ncbi:MAG TPA: acyl-CoA thioesterase/bile acid-CoA:amino acid N-acyltransferase family protein [Gemmatimonadaceae bacterium]|nr:acyl-CoA thioesterase/bile acid-CoA:amino acid N-acyltransferase family protein [Gemmatimonadaceae bacterium]
MTRRAHIWLGVASVAAAGSMSAQSLRVEPRTALVDSSVRITVTGLEPGQAVILRASRTDSAGRTWQSFAGYRADARGMVDLSHAAPANGFYHGVTPMGLLVSMDVGGPARGTLRYPFKWADTIRTQIALEIGGRTVSVDTLTQTFTTPGVGMRSVRDGGLVGTIFTPADSIDRGAVLVLGGSEGGVSSEDIAAQLASHGYVAFALAYFGADSLPTSLDNIPLEYFGRALTYLRADPAVGHGAIAILATSKGAEAALAAAAHFPEVRAVVGYAPSSVHWSCICASPHSSWSLGGVGLPNVPAGTDPTYLVPPGFPLRPAVNYLFRMRDSSVAAQAAIHVEDIKGPILLVAGDDDGLWPSLSMAREVMARRGRLGAKHGDVLLHYAGAGHLIGKAFLPAGSTLIGGGRVDTGGTPAGNSLAQADAWPRVLEFLRRALRASAAATPRRSRVR